MAIQSILYPTDFSENAEAAIPYVQEMIRRFDGDLHLLYVIESTLSAADLSWTISPPDIESKLSDTARGRLQDLANALEIPEEKITLAIAKGHPSLEVLRYAEDNDISLIIMATHGHSGLTHFLLGSVAERVVRNANCPVLTVKSGAKT